MTTTTAPEAPATSPVPGQRTGSAAAGPVRGAGASVAGGASGGGSATPPHRVLAFARAMEGALDRMGDPAAWAMTPAEQRQALLLMDRLASRFTALQLQVLTAADRNAAGKDSGATSTAAWLADQTRQTRPRCSSAVRLAAELDDAFAATRDALSSGRINRDQAAVIVEAVNTLTQEYDDLPVGTDRRAEAHLLELAAKFDAIELRKLGKRLFEVVCPEAADAAEGQRLAREEERARRKASLRMRDNGDGTVEGWFKIPVLHAELLKKSLEALTSPRRLGDSRIDPRTGKKLPYQVLLGQGFMELLECHLDPKHLPSQGGSPFTLVVTIGIDALMSGVGVATLESGARISAGEYRRLACKAGIIPMVLDGDSMPLDLGREQRLFSKYQRIAMAEKYKGCAAANCDRPPSWTEAHHDKPWAEGGRTDLKDGIPLCPPHHHMADHPESWNMKRLPNGAVRFSRRQ